jgi:general secretion pathway protein G
MVKFYRLMPNVERPCRPAKRRRNNRGSSPIRQTTDAGFTLLELLVVLGILALLATIATPQVVRYLGKARTETARAQLASISTALELYSLDNGSFPSAQVGLTGLVKAPPNPGSWRGPYLKKAEGLIDPWGRPYQYRPPAKGVQPQVFTFGRDNAAGGEAEDQDLVN